VLVYGGGYIAVEFASIFNTLGAHTTLVCRSERLLKSFDQDISTHLCEAMAKKGMHLNLSNRIKSLARGPDGILVSLDHGPDVTVDTVLFATGRAPRTHGMGLEEAGVRLGTNGCIEVDEHFRSSVESIYAIGDVIDRVQLTPVATREGMTVADDLFGEKIYRTSYVNVPTAVFSHPNVASVGMSQQGAVASGHNVRIFRSVFTPLRHTLSKNPEKVMLKVVVDAISDLVLGVHMVGPEAGEVIQGFAVALNCGAKKSDFDRTIGIHPTIAEELVTMRTAEL
jgi:glutathione reductase (NADPH)